MTCLFMARLSRSVSGVAHCLLIPCWRGRGTSDTRKRSALNISTAMRIKDSNGLFLTSSLDVFTREFYSSPIGLQLTQTTPAGIREARDIDALDAMVHHQVVV